MGAEALCFIHYSTRAWYGVPAMGRSGRASAPAPAPHVSLYMLMLVPPTPPGRPWGRCPFSPLSLWSRARSVRFALPACQTD